jgi:hypothetical protein
MLQKQRGRLEGKVREDEHQDTVGSLLKNDENERSQKAQFRLANEKIIRMTARNNMQKRGEERKKWEKAKEKKRKLGSGISDDEEEPTRDKKRGRLVWKPYKALLWVDI